MTKSALGRVLDLDELASATGPRARLRVSVAKAWMEGDQVLELAVATPARLLCARCDGGGCDGCGKSGALRAPEDPSERLLRASLPPSALASSSVVLRIAQPFGERSPVEQLLLEVTAGESASAGVSCAPRAIVRAPKPPAALSTRRLALAVATLALLLAAVIEAAHGTRP